MASDIDTVGFYAVGRWHESYLCLTCGKLVHRGDRRHVCFDEPTDLHSRMAKILRENGWTCLPPKPEGDHE